MTNNEINSKPLAVITGASSGIGLELAKVFSKNGYTLLVCAEDEGINTVAQQLSAKAVQADLKTEEGVEQLFSEIQNFGQPLDSICINAGVGHGKAFTDQSLDQIFEMIDLNVRGTTHLAYLVLQEMKKRNAGKILFTASVVSTMPNPFQAVYAATKAFDLSLAEALRDEVKDTNITITALRPGATDTNFFERGGLMDTKVGVSEKDDPAEVAQDGFDALMAGKDAVVAGSFKNKVQVAQSNIMPDPMIAKQAGKQAKPGSASEVPPEKRAS